MAVLDLSLSLVYWFLGDPASCQWGVGLTARFLERIASKDAPMGEQHGPGCARYRGPEGWIL